MVNRLIGELVSKTNYLVLKIVSFQYNFDTILYPVVSAVFTEHLRWLLLKSETLLTLKYVKEIAE